MKIQLENKDVLSSLQELEKCFEKLVDYCEHQQWEYAQNVHFQGRLKKVIDLAFQICQDNIQIKGTDWSSYDSNAIAMEAFDEELSEKLRKTQIEVNTILLDVTKSRDEVPKSLGEIMEAKKKKNVLEIDKYLSSRIAKVSQPLALEENYEQLHQMESKLMASTNILAELCKVSYWRTLSLMKIQQTIPQTTKSVSKLLDSIVNNETIHQYQSNPFSHQLKRTSAGL